MRAAFLCIALMTACGGTAGQLAVPGPVGDGDGDDLAPVGPTASGPASGAAELSGCDTTDTTETRLLLAPGETRTIDADFTVTFVSLQVDHYDDGGFDMIAQLEFRRGALTENRLVSLLAPHGPERLLGSCVRISGAEGDKVAVDLGLSGRGEAPMP